MIPIQSGHVWDRGGGGEAETGAVPAPGGPRQKAGRVRDRGNKNQKCII